MNWGELIKVLSAALSPIVAIGAAVIAIQQNRTRKRQVRLGLFDKRYEVFVATMKLLSAAVSNANVTLDDLFAFLAATRTSAFLFGKDVQQYIDEVYDRCVDLHHKMETGVARRDNELMRWFIGQSDTAKEKFGRYLTMPDL